MFTGIIEDIGTVIAVTPFGKGRSVQIETNVHFEGLKMGDSVAINGVCLTVVGVTRNTFTVEAVEETLVKTTTGGLKSGHRVNLERALQAQGRLDGHFVQGHVDGVSTIEVMTARSESWWIGISYRSAESRLLIPRGSIAVDGVSLTVAEKQSSVVFVSVIPHTFRHTILAHWSVGRRVNMEFDVLGKYIVNALDSVSAGNGLTPEALRSLGY